MLPETKLNFACLALGVALLLPACKKQVEVESPPLISSGEVVLSRPPIPLWPSDSDARFVVRSFRDWEDVWQRTAVGRKTQDRMKSYFGPRALPVGLDFEKNILLIVFSLSDADEQSVEITSMKEKGNNLQAEVILNTCLPPPGTAKLAVATIISIGDAVVIEKTDKKIIFNVVQTNQCPHPKLKQNMIRSN